VFVKSDKKRQADMAKSLALLWGSHSHAGRSGLTLKAIITTAMEIADREGLDALSMRKVADQLGVGTMTLYSHLPGKHELVELMFDAACGELYASVEEPSQQGKWQDGLRFIARQNWNLYGRHPWLLQYTTSRPALGPHIMLKYEAELRPLDGIGLSDLEMDGVLTLVISHVEGCARMRATMQQTVQDTGMSDVEWWVNSEPILSQIMSQMVDPTRFPVAGRVGSSAGEAFQATSSPEHALDFGMERILAGVAELVESKRATSAPRPKPTA
jgi:AcrR family transcriptional regulator